MTHLIHAACLIAFLAFVLRCEGHVLSLWARELEKAFRRIYREPGQCSYRPGKHRAVERA